MTCDQFERTLLELPSSGSLADTALATHLAGCMRCQATTRTVAELDLELTRGLVAPVLDVSFVTEILQRVDALRCEPLELEQRRSIADAIEMDARERRQSRRVFGKLVRTSLPDLAAAVCLSLLGFSVLSSALRETEFLPNALRRFVSSAPMAGVTVLLIGLCLFSAVWTTLLYTRSRPS